MSTNCTIYIDEAGDLGIGRGTRWFVLTAVVVNNEDELYIRDIIRNLKRQLNIGTIHFRNLRNFEQRAYVVNAFSEASFEYINIVLDTSKIELPKLAGNRDAFTEAPSILLYNHACRYLIERVSWLLRDTDRKGKIVLSSRGTSRDEELINYLKDKLIDYSNNKISNRFSEICSKTAESWDMLQLADVCATSMFYYHEINRYGFIIPCYAFKLRKFLYNRNSIVDKYGIKYYADDMKPDGEYFKEHMVCK